MGLFSFHKRTKHRSFEYIPRYYDPEKEALEQRRKLYDKSEDGLDMTKERIKSGFKHRYRGDQKFRSSQVSKSNIRLVYIILILAFLSYLFLQSDGILKILESFTNG